MGKRGNPDGIERRSAEFLSTLAESRAVQKGLRILLAIASQNPSFRGSVKIAGTELKKDVPAPTVSAPAVAPPDAPASAANTPDAPARPGGARVSAPKDTANVQAVQVPASTSHVSTPHGVPSTPEPRTPLSRKAKRLQKKKMRRIAKRRAVPRV